MTRKLPWPDDSNRERRTSLSPFTTYYNTRRSHMERDYLPPIRDVPTMDQIEVKSYVGGLVKSFERKAA